MTHASSMDTCLPEYADALSLKLMSISLIQRNKYCAIFKGLLENGQKCIIKDYGDSDPNLAFLEAESLNVYHEICRDSQELKSCRLLAYNGERNLLAISFMEGDSYTRFVYHSLLSSKQRASALKHARSLGRLLRELYLRHHTMGGVVGGFMGEYMRHSTNNLKRYPLLGRLCLGKNAPEIEDLLGAMAASGEPTSFCHGDCVLRNAHADNQGIGLIDWANTSKDSHILNDVYNLQTAVHNLFIPARYKRQLISALSDGLGDLSFDISLHRFFYEYHRRRWLMLKLYARRPWPLFQVLRGLLTFAKPFNASDPGALNGQIKDMK